MSYLYVVKSRGNKQTRYRIYIGFTDQYGIKHRRPVGITMDAVTRRNGKIIFPGTARDIQRSIDDRIARRVWGIDDKPKNGAIRLSELTRLWLDGPAKEYASRRSYQIATNNFVRHCGDLFLPEITPEVMEHFRDVTRKNNGEQTAANFIRHLSPMFSWAVLKGRMMKSPIVKGIRLNPVPPEPAIFGQKQLEELWAEGINRGWEDSVAQWKFLYYSGCRAMESCVFREEQFDREGRAIKFWNRKKKRWENQPVDDEFFAFLVDTIRSNIYSPRLFRYADPSALERKLKKLTVDHFKWSENLTLHTFKTNAVERWRKMGLDFAEVSRLAKHRSVQTTLRHYTYFDVDTTREKMNAALRKAAKKNKLFQIGSSIIRKAKIGMRE